MWKAYKIGPRPSVSFFTLGRLFTQIRNGTPDPWLAAALKQVRPDIEDYSWLKAYAANCVKYALHDLELAYKAYFTQPAAGKPRRHGRYRTTPSFCIPAEVKIRDGLLQVPKIGRLRLKDHGTRQPYEHCEAKTVRIRREGTGRYPKWYAYVTYAVPSELLPEVPTTGAVGVDRNVGQCTDSDGQTHALPATAVEDAKIKRYQRKWHRQRKDSNRRRRTGHKLGKLHRKQVRRRDTAMHTVSRKLADKAHTVVLENLDTKAMTKSAKEDPGRNVKQKAGLNRSILASGWGQLERKLAYKAGQVVQVPAAHTSVKPTPLY